MRATQITRATPSRGGGVYLRRLQFELPYQATAANAQSRYVSQDLTIQATSQLQDSQSKLLAASAGAEATVNSRYFVALRNWLNFTTGFPEYLK